MANKQEIELIIRPDGSVEERVTGISGARCEEVTAALEQALGAVIERKQTPDYYRESDDAGDSVVARS